MWTIGGADRPRFPRFSSKLEKRANARLPPHTHRPHQQGELIIDDSKNHTRPAERTNGVHSNHLTPKAPYKPAPAKAGGRCMDNIFVERLWRSLKYEEVYLHAYATVAEARTGIGPG